MTDQARAQESSTELFGSDRMWGLKELPLPEPVSWWPQTAGWAVLAVVLLILMAWAGYKAWRRVQRNAYRRDGLARLEAMKKDGSALGELPLLLRQSALQAAPRKDVAGLRGTDWINWLNASAGRPLFGEDDASLLDELAYAKESDGAGNDVSVQHVLEASREWMRSHRAAV
jgi:hypothetical protein